MGYGDLRDDWRINDIEKTANEAHRRLYEIDALDRKMDSLERENRELRSDINGFRSEIQALQDELRGIRERLVEAIPEFN